MQIEDRAGLGEAELYKATQALLGARRIRRPSWPGSSRSFQINVPQLDADVDREKVKQQGVSLTDSSRRCRSISARVYVNDFNRFGRTYQVIAQADAPFRRRRRHRAAQGAQRERRDGAARLGAHGAGVYGPDRVLRYNAYPAADINGGRRPGSAPARPSRRWSGWRRETLPNGIGYEWTELTYQQILAGNTALFVFPLCVLLVFLVLAAQYESWSLPLAVILIVPMCLLSAIAGVWLTRGDNNIFTQIGFVVLVGLACKNAILIVEFARELENQGRTAVDAALEACRSGCGRS